MVQVDNVTYRIVRVQAGEYEVVRLLDDARIGRFSLAGRQVASEANTVEVVRAVARVALQGGRTSWVPRFAEPR